MRFTTPNSHNGQPRLRQSHHRGLTLMESLIAVSLTTLAGGALLGAVSSAVMTSSDSTYTVISQGLADQLMDEISLVRFPASVQTTQTGMTSTLLTGRAAFDDLDDYHNWNASPPQSRYGQAIGTDQSPTGTTPIPRPIEFQPSPELMNRFREQVTVEKISPSTNGGWTVVSSATPYRRVTVTISYTDARNQTRPLAVQTRVFSDVALTP